MDVLLRFSVIFLSPFLIQCSNNKVAAPSSQFIKSGNPDCGSREVKGQYLVHWKNGDITVEDYEDDETFIKDFIEKNSDLIKVAEPHYRIQLDHQEKLVQRGWGGHINWGVESIEAEILWEDPEERSEVIVAIVDSGMDKSHDQLKDALAINVNEEINGIDDDGNGLIDDRYGFDFVNGTGEVSDYTGHGTHIAGIIAAKHEIGKVWGVAPNVKLLPLNFINSDGGGLVQGAINAIRYAAQRKAKIINASWGGEVCSIPLRDEIAALAKQDILFIAAAGNSGNDIRSLPEFPAAFVLSNMITVGASTYDNKTAGFSNYGTLVDLVAPGANIVSTYPMEFDSDGNPDGMVALNGTSMATPFVVAAAALLWGKKPDASYLDIRRALLDGVVPGPYQVKTRGMLNVRKAQEILLKQ